MIPAVTGRLFAIFIFPSLIALGGFKDIKFFYFGFGLNLLIILLCMIEYRKKTHSIQFDYRLNFPQTFSIGRVSDVKFTFINQSKKKQKLQVILPVPAYWENNQPEQSQNIGLGSSYDFIFPIISMKRNEYIFNNIILVFYTDFGLMKIPINLSIDRTVRVYPDVKELNRYIKMMRLNRSAFEGNHINKFQGSGTELNYLREYHMDDDFRLIDWKATTRNGKPVSKVFRNESAGAVTFIIDCGRMMLPEVNGLTALDHAVNSILLLSNIIIKAGDSVSILAFSDKIIGYIAPVRGKNAMNKILKFITRLQPESVESNYSHAFEYLRTKLKKRAMVIMISDVMDDINYSVLNSGLMFFNRRHLSVLVLLRDVTIAEHADKTINNKSDLYVMSAAREMVIKREVSLKKLRKNGIGILDLLPASLTPGMINKYFEAKASNLL